MNPNSYLFADDDIEEMKMFNRKKINRLRYQQVKEAIRQNRKYNHRTDLQIASDFDISPRTMSRIKNSRSYNKYLKRSGKNETGNFRGKYSRNKK